MLILKQFDVRLIRLELEHIELLRSWRNAAHVKNQMVYRDYITEEMQSAWFASINNQTNYYFMIEFENQLVGLINAKNYQKDVGFGEGGIFIGEKEFEDSLAAVYASLTLLNFVFHFLPHIQYSKVKILKSNARAIQYNKLLGYVEQEGAQEEHDQLYTLTRERYLQKAFRLNQAAKSYSKGSSEMELIGIPSERNMKEINDLLQSKTPPRAIPGL